MTEGRLTVSQMNKVVVSRKMIQTHPVLIKLPVCKTAQSSHGLALRLISVPLLTTIVLQSHCKYILGSMGVSSSSRVITVISHRI